LADGFALIGFLVYALLRYADSGEQSYALRIANLVAAVPQRNIIFQLSDKLYNVYGA
jgi:hypothetical protein